MITGIFYYLSDRINAYNKYRKARRELSRLTDKELSDIGVSRCDIENIARNCFKDKIQTT